MNKENLIKFVLKAYWGDQLVEVKPACNGDVSLFYIADCGYYLCGAMEGTWEDAWMNPNITDPVLEALEDGIGIAGDLDVLRAVTQVIGQL